MVLHSSKQVPLYQVGEKEYKCVKLFMWEITRELNGIEQGTKSAFKIETREHAENLSI